MKRLIVLVVASALVLAACGSSGGDVAATVNNEEITSAQVNDLLGSEVTITPELLAQSLTTLIQWKVTELAAADEFAFAPTDEEIDTQVAIVVAQAGAESLDQIAESQGVPVDLLRRYIVQLMTRDAVTEEFDTTLPEPTDDEVAEQLTDFAEDWTSVCASHLLVDTKEEADAAILRITAGEDFATVATTVSTDTSTAVNGGDLGCNTAGQYVDAFATAVMEAPLDTVTGPIETEFGFHVVVVTEREQATQDDVRSTLKQRAALEASDAWFLAALEAASVTVDPVFGTWTLDPDPRVDPPAETDE